MAPIISEPHVEPMPETLEEQFARLAETWHGAIAHVSSSSIRDRHPTYLAIIALGPLVVPIILRDLENTHRHWFTALSAITGANPIAKTDAGNIGKVTQAWLDWGRTNSFHAIGSP